MPEAAQGRGFEGLACYQQALRLFEAAYRLAARLPESERYNLADQLRRASLGVLLNIAEGYGRYHYLDKLRFFYIARGSLCETLSACVAACRADYIDEVQLAWVRSTEAETERLLNGYIGFIRKQQQGGAEFGKTVIREQAPEYAIPLLADTPQAAVGSADPQSLVPDHHYLSPETAGDHTDD